MSKWDDFSIFGEEVHRNECVLIDAIIEMGAKREKGGLQLWKSMRAFYCSTRSTENWRQLEDALLWSAWNLKVQWIEGIDNDSPPLQTGPSHGPGREGGVDDEECDVPRGHTGEIWDLGWKWNLVKWGFTVGMWVELDGDGN